MRARWLADCRRRKAGFAYCCTDCPIGGQCQPAGQSVSQPAGQPVTWSVSQSVSKSVGRSVTGRRRVLEPFGKPAGQLARSVKLTSESGLATDKGRLSLNCDTHLRTCCSQVYGLARYQLSRCRHRVVGVIIVFAGSLCFDKCLGHADRNRAQSTGSARLWARA